MNIYYITWTESSYSGKVKTGTDMLQAENKEEAKQRILLRNKKKKINSTNIKVYDFSKICEKYNVEYKIKEKEKVKAKEIKPKIKHKKKKEEETNNNEEELF